MEILLGTLVGLGLSAACGFRVFVPLLVVSVASYAGHLDLASGFDWMGTLPAVVAFSLATALEVAGYYIPWVDHFLDTIATPAAVVAGTIITASFVGDISPFLKWTLAIVAGGGSAGAIQAATVGIRGLSLASSGGLANPLVSTLELVGSVLLSFLSLVAPALVLALIICVAVGAVYRLRTAV